MKISRLLGWQTAHYLCVARANLNDDRKQHFDSCSGAKVVTRQDSSEDDRHVRWDVSIHDNNSRQSEPCHGLHHSDSQTSGIFSQVSTVLNS